ncbi:hypothetical protein NL676_035064 [Syzygium grande]|nr:hypothetical protein NL676_035064 [Syzygium grande]
MARVKWIQSKVSNSVSSTSHSKESTINLPASYGPSGYSYVVTIGLGTPTKDLTLLFDTGSALTWTQCEPCIVSCYSQAQPIFDPSQSSSYANISCNASSCTQLSSTTGNQPNCSGSTCFYGAIYGDKSFSDGFFATETLTLTPKDVITNFEFGCVIRHQHNRNQRSREPTFLPSTVFSNAGTIIDSGTSYTHLPPTAYNALQSAFQEAMANYTSTPPFSPLDTCYDLSGVGTMTFPVITFSFSGPINVDLDVSGTFYVVSASQVCLAFVPNSADTDVGVYGNIQQRTFEVVYDVLGGQIGFGAQGCS